MSRPSGALTRSFDNGPFEKGFRDRIFEAP
jgi:hypothetical protein